MALNLKKTIQDIMKGDIDSYRKIIHEFQKEVWKVVAAMLHNRETTEELVQETFVKGYIHLDQFDINRDFAKWIKGIARNVVREKLRTSFHTEKHLSLYHEHLKQNLSDDKSYVQYKERLADALDKCRQELPQPSKDILDMRYRHSVSFDHIAQKTGRSLEGVRQLLWRIKLKLKNCIKKKIADHGTS